MRQFAARHRHVDPVRQPQSRSVRDIYRHDQPPPPTPPFNAPLIPQPTPYPQQPPPPNVLTVLQRTTHIEIPGLERPKLIKPNTRSKQESFSYEDVTVVGTWKEFTSANVLSTFGHLLAGTPYTYSNPITSPNSPAAKVYDENGVAYRLSTEVHQVLRRCLRQIFATHSHPRAAGSGELIPPNAALSVIVHDVGSAAVFPRSELPDYSSCTPLPPRASRLPGDCKVDWKWRANWRTVGEGDVTEPENRQYFQVLSQIYFYMYKTKARYATTTLSEPFFTLIN